LPVVDNRVSAEKLNPNNNKRKANQMNISTSSAVALMVSLGFPQAAEWDVAKLRKFLKKVPEKVDEDDVAKEHLETFQAIRAAVLKSESIHLSNDQDATSKKGKKSKKPVKKASPPPDEDEDENDQDEAPPSKKGKKAASPKEAPPKIELDKFGSRVGTISAKVNAAITSKWKSEAEIIEETGLTQTQVRDVLYLAAQKKQVVRERVIRFREVGKE